MKTIIAATMLAFGLQAYAADEFHTVLKCKPLKPVPDASVNLQVQQGGFAGITQIVVDQSLLAHRSTQTYVVHKEMRDPRRIGAPIVYTGQEIELQVNFTTAPLPGGGHIGHVTILGRNQDTLVQDLNCMNTTEVEE